MDSFSFHLGDFSTCGFGALRALVTGDFGLRRKTELPGPELAVRGCIHEAGARTHRRTNVLAVLHRSILGFVAVGTDQTQTATGGWAVCVERGRGWHEETKLGARTLLVVMLSVLVFVRDFRTDRTPTENRL